MWHEAVESLARACVSHSHPFPRSSGWAGVRGVEAAPRDAPGLPETGRGQTIYIRGEAGIGKSRVVEAFKTVAQEWCADAGTC
jgi:hypothetical protein